jgi:hypothetical protein
MSNYVEIANLGSQLTAGILQNISTLFGGTDCESFRAPLPGCQHKVDRDELIVPG